MSGITGSGSGSTNAGPHNSNLANKLDPRVDSDLDGGTNMGMSQGRNPGRSALAGSSNTAGPHRTDLGNKVDPRVDSDLDGSRNMGAAGNTATAGTFNNSGANYIDPRSTNAGPHSSNVANKLDPRVDSDRDGSRNAGMADNTGAGYSTTGTGTTGTTGITGATGTGHHHHGHLGNTLPGPAPNTAGPHKSDVLNKLDPRVDSDLDGPKTVGGNATYNQ